MISGIEHEQMDHRISLVHDDEDQQLIKYGHKKVKYP